MTGRRVASIVVVDLTRLLSYMKAHADLDDVRLVDGTEDFSPLA